MAKKSKKEKSIMPSQPTIPATSKPAVAPVRRLYRSNKNKVLGGVCGGLGEYFNIDPVLIRLIWIFFVLFWGTGLLAYIIAWLVIPRKSDKSK